MAGDGSRIVALGQPTGTRVIDLSERVGTSRELIADLKRKFPKHASSFGPDIPWLKVYLHDAAEMGAIRQVTFSGVKWDMVDTLKVSEGGRKTYATSFYTEISGVSYFGVVRDSRPEMARETA